MPPATCNHPTSPKNSKNGSRSVRRVTRLHGELYTALAAEAAKLGIKPASLAAHILCAPAALPDKSAPLHPLTEAYLPTHNPRVAPSDKARTITITLPKEVLDTLLHAAEHRALSEGHRPNGGAGEAQRFAQARAEWLRKLQTSTLISYLDRYGAL